jgi:hypothetical protein
VAELVRLYTGVRPLIVEAYQDRHLWILGESSQLGFDTGLAPLDPEGILVPGDSSNYVCGQPTSGPAEQAMPGQAPEEESDLEGQQAWSEPEDLVVGNVVVGQGGPLAFSDLGEPLFRDTAHLFTVLFPAATLADATQRSALIAMLESEKPAHTDYHLCLVEARMRVGFQARVGVDTIVAGPPDPLALDEATLNSAGLGLPDGEEGASRVGPDARLGQGLKIS